MSFAPGALVKARGREWVVLPESEDDLLLLRPLGGSQDSVTGILPALEQVESASFELPDPTDAGDYFSCRLLREAIRLGIRSSAGPFRSFARLAVDPRPYQLVPLLVALKQDPIRILIADDVGIGKTIEACLIARELLDRGEIQRIAILCPPHLTEQWQQELSEKFHIDAEVVIPSTVNRLERSCGINESLFDVHPFVIVSTDFIKSERRRDDFARSCPEFVIVDEAHTCASAQGERGGRHQRWELIKSLSESGTRHIVLVSATPHSGKAESFRSLLSLLDSSLSNLPEDLSGEQNRRHRELLARYMVQRRRGDIRPYLEDDTPFPDREESEFHYRLSPAYRRLFDRVLDYAREVVADQSGSKVRQRVRWWSALALLRSLASSPAAAAETLRNRAQNVTAVTEREADDVGRASVMDVMDDEQSEGTDVVPGTLSKDDIDDEEDKSSLSRRQLNDLAKMADEVFGREHDSKLAGIIPKLKSLINEGYHPIVFCRFIPTAEYLAEQLREAGLGRGVEIASVTGKLPPSEREQRVAELGKAPKRVLVCTDCLSEGINLQDNFDCVIHYDLAWNPTRHEQREGRVDRYGQGKDIVRVLTYYGTDNQIDGIVLNILIEKHKAIRRSLNVSIPIPVNTEQVMEAILEGLLLRGKTGQSDQLVFDKLMLEASGKLDAEWNNAAEREKKSRSLFAQHTIDFREVARELDAVRSAIGSGISLKDFTADALRMNQAVVSMNGSMSVDVSECPRGLRDSLPLESEQWKAGFRLPVPEKAIYLHRTHPVVASLASYVVDTALDPLFEGKAKRCGVIRTKGVERRTTLLLLRLRYHIITTRRGEEKRLLAEDTMLVPFAGSPANAEWLDPAQAEALLRLEPDGNTDRDVARERIQQVIDSKEALMPHLEELAVAHGEILLEAHTRVRQAARETGVKHRIEPTLPPDILGIYIYLPIAN